ncbi:major capsid protein [Streptomyces sp. AGS-58]|uniref:major capsid protein n=1 Tax=unclassified Streptomyces TaxID=2593676 RepID=UPI0035A38CE8
MQPEPYKLPDDITALGNEDLERHLAAAREAFQAKREDPNLDIVDMPAVRELAAGIKAMQAEQDSRVEQAKTALAELDTLAAEVGLPVETPAVEPATADGLETLAVEPATVEPPAAEAESPVEGGEEVAAAAAAVPARRAPLLSTVRLHQPKQLVPRNGASGLTITASAEVPGSPLGATLDMEGLTESVTRAAGLVKGGGQAIAASYQLPFAQDLVVNDAGSLEEGTMKVLKASDQRRLKGGDLVASGGWCAPSETIYDFVEYSCPDNLWDLPEISLSRGGIRYYMTPELDVNAMSWEWTEADDISAVDGDPTKPCFKIPCQDPVEVRCTVYGVCVQAGILSQRFFPELNTFYIRRAMVAYEMRLKAAMYAQARAKATPVTTAPSFASFTAVYGALALQVADMVERWHLCDTINLEVAMPWWARNMFLADIARRSGSQICDLPARCIEDKFAEIGVRVNWVKNIPPAVPAQIGGTKPATDWPDTIEVLLYPAGAFQMGRGPEVNLGVVHDSTLMRTNDMTALFFESCNALIYRGPESRRVTIPVCADGSVGPRITPACPTA